METQLVRLEHRIEALEKRATKLEQQNEVFMYPVDKRLDKLQTALNVIYIVFTGICITALTLLPIILERLK